MKSKYVRPARLPDGAYEHMGGLNYYEQKKRDSKEEIEEKEYTRCEAHDTHWNERCISHVNRRQSTYSRDHFNGRILCFRHQAIERIKRR